MSRETVSSPSKFVMTLFGLVLFGSFSTITAAQESTGSNTELRTSISRHSVKGGRDNPTSVVTTTEDYDKLVSSGNRSQGNTRAGFAKPGAGSTRSEATNLDFWIFDADVVLFNDDDRDGFYHGIDLLFDADTNFLAADVYAVLYLSYEGGPWNEYAVTEDFTIFGASSSDEYVLVTELMTGYPTGSYDLLIELFDALDGAFLTSFGPQDSSELSFLPLEDFNRDEPIGSTQVVVNRGGGGAMDGWMLGMFLLILLGGAVRKIWRRRNDTLIRIDSPAPCWQAYADQDHQNLGNL